MGLLMTDDEPTTMAAELTSELDEAVTEIRRAQRAINTEDRPDFGDQDACLRALTAAVQRIDFAVAMVRRAA